jgi:hypothetical protein
MRERHTQKEAGSRKKREQADLAEKKGLDNCGLTTCSVESLI